MSHRLIYLIGQPGAGKSTLMAKLTEHLDRTLMTSAPVAHSVLYYADGDIAGAEIGRPRENFGGTDALPASIIERAIPWVQTKPYELLLAEGARLANKRFIDAAVEAGYAVTLAFLDHGEAETWRQARADALGRDQNSAWVKSRRTASLNLAQHYIERPNSGVRVNIGHPDTLLSELEHLLD